MNAGALLIATAILTPINGALGAGATRAPTRGASISEQEITARIDRAASRHYAIAVRFGSYVGWSLSRTVDEGRQFYANEAGTWAKDGPMMTIQPPATPSVGYAYVRAYEATRNPRYLEVARSVGDTLLAIQAKWHGGWHQDMFFEGGEWRYAMVWGLTRRDYTTEPSNRGIQGVQKGAVTLDDGTSQAAALFLLRLCQAGGGEKYLDGAKRFGDALCELREVKDARSGKRPYASGGIPQVFPLEVAMQIVFTGEAGTPGEHYYVHKTINDHTTEQALLFLMELHAETKEERYLEAIRLNVDYLLDRHEALGNRAWCQQYHYLTDEPAWARHKEPPAFVSGEDGVIDVLLAWLERETDGARKQRILRAIRSALLYWKDTAPHVNPQEKDPRRWQWWRYYNMENQPIFANGYKIWVGVENADKAAAGQPWKLGNPRRWLGRILGGGDRLDLSRPDRWRHYLAADNIFALGGDRLEKVVEAQREDGLWVKTVRIGGEPRAVAPAGVNAQNLCVLAGALRRVPR
ncbi:MAG: hypothetical protein JXQ73_12025 [Phycisphaerae bacterium]|nr:hypothetical protein [Phycisphaerae bacterium]